MDVELEGEAETAEFTNDYHASGAGVIELTKNLTGRPTGLAAGEFTFAIEEIVTDEDGTESRVPVTADGTNPMTATNDADGKIRFELTYDETDQGAHTYVITEENTGDPNIVYDTKEIQVTVNVTDNGNGTLKAEAVYPEDVTFNNNYTARAALLYSPARRISWAAEQRRLAQANLPSV